VAVFFKRKRLHDPPDGFSIAKYDDLSGVLNRLETPTFQLAFEFAATDELFDIARFTSNNLSANSRLRCEYIIQPSGG
jgi:hypothetical protein